MKRFNILMLISLISIALSGCSTPHNASSKDYKKSKCACFENQIWNGKVYKS